MGAAACSQEAPDSTPASQESEATDPQAGESTSPSEPVETSTEPAGSSEPADTVTVPLYFVGETPQGPRLFREFRAVPSDKPLVEAAALVTAGDTLDPDYRSLWPLLEITEISATDGLLLVHLPGDGFTERPDGMSKQDAELAIQQLVYTLQGVQQERVPVQFDRPDTSARLFGLSTESPYSNAPALEVSSMVNITSPEQGSAVGGDTLAASGVASSFEATVPWEIRQGETVVLEGFATAEGWMDKLYPWETDVDVSTLAPGDYTFVALTSDPSDGEGGGPHEDTKDFVLN
ncbi:MAG: hypothetical protein JWN68_782 [Nocardioides sp.]|nr:hypothetical protein [Nocardioides sp.]